ncbi:zinc finger protein 684-like isoform X2 [Eleutherodactylus coqui]|uniref:zinc finger protein 684-like isoform X2 n=1 Tax=Eleutherodactylus coqui TaxID=57060 RepID=UPI0034621141
MGKGRNPMTERVLNVTLEIIYLLTGKDYILVNKISEDEGWERAQSPFVDLSFYSQMNVKNNEQKVLEIANMIIHLLTGEVPLRCQNAAIHFSMQEWEYLQKHKDVYKDALMENHQPLTSLVPDFPVLMSPRSFLYKTIVIWAHGANNDENKMVKSILNLFIEIIDLLTGEDYAVVQRTSGECLTFTTQPHVYDGSSRTRSTTAEPTPYLVIQERNNKQKILELTNKIIQVLTGEVPVRCEDVTVYFSMEEWEYVEGHKDLYHDVMLEAQQLFTSLGDCTKLSVGYSLFPEYDVDLDISQHTFDTFVEPTITQNISSFLAGRDLSSDTNNHKESSSDQTQTIKQASSRRRKEKIFTCSECGKHYKNIFNLSMHMRMHRNVRPFSCSECGKCFTKKSILVEHQRVHTGEKPYSCSECGKCFTKKSAVVEHQLTHTGDRSFLCSECGRGFYKKSHLERHQRTHTGERPFACTECGKCFTKKSILVEHRRIHTGEKPFSCSECGKCFVVKRHCERHQITHTGDRPFLCSECGRCFARKSHLERHLTTHTEENNTRLQNVKNVL